MVLPWGSSDASSRWTSIVLEYVVERIVSEYQGGRINSRKIHSDMVCRFRKIIPEMPSLRTLQGWAKSYKEKNQTPTVHDGLFEWHRLEEYGLPWEASAYLLDMYSYVTQGEYAIMKRKYAIMKRTAYDSPIPTPTVRQAAWWWRVHLAVPDMEDKLNIHLWSQAYVRREVFRDVLSIPVSFADLDGYFTYKPWMSASHLSRYRYALSEELIPPLISTWAEYKNVVRVGEFPENQEVLQEPHLSPEYPERLPSKSFIQGAAHLVALKRREEKQDQRIKELEEEIREQES